MSLVNMLYNLQLLKYIGQDGIAAYGVLMYVSLVFQAVFIGYSVGVAPIIGYHYGAQNSLELKGVLKKSLVLLAFFSGAMFGASYLLARPLSFVFTGYDAELLALTVRAFSLFAFSFLFSGYVIFGSSFEQWAGFCGDFLSADDGVPDSGGSYLSADLGGGWDLDLHGRCGDTGSRGDGDFPGSGKEAVRVLVMVPISLCIVKPVAGRRVNRNEK